MAKKLNKIQLTELVINPGCFPMILHRTQYKQFGPQTETKPNKTIKQNEANLKTNTKKHNII